MNLLINVGLISILHLDQHLGNFHNLAIGIIVDNLDNHRNFKDLMVDFRFICTMVAHIL